MIHQKCVAEVVDSCRTLTDIFIWNHKEQTQTSEAEEQTTPTIIEVESNEPKFKQLAGVAPRQGIMSVNFTHTDQTCVGVTG